MARLGESRETAQRRGANAAITSCAHRFEFSVIDETRRERASGCAESADESHEHTLRNCTPCCTLGLIVGA